jgi:hypothetical protein
MTAEDIECVAAIEGLEALILAHTCAGIDVATRRYIEGIETAVDAIDQAIVRCSPLRITPNSRSLGRPFRNTRTSTLQPANCLSRSLKNCWPLNP